MPVQNGCEYLLERRGDNRVAILFGSEDKGLSNEEVAACGLMFNIPTSREHRSLNLSQAVLIIAYELLKAENSRRQTTSQTFCRSGMLAQLMSKPVDPAVLVSQEKMKALYSRMTDTLKQLEYLPRGNTALEAKIMQNLKYFIARAGITDREMRMLYGLCSQIEKKIVKGKK